MTVSFKFKVAAFNSTVQREDQLAVINSFAYLGFKGPIEMKNPDVQFTVLEDYKAGSPGKETPQREWIYMGRVVST